MNLMEWVKCTRNIPFADEKILYLRTADENHFIVRESYIENASIPVESIIGTCHPSYGGITWREFLSIGQRIGSALDWLENNPEYYLQKNQKDHIGYIKRPEGYYIEEGNHRSVLAKFLFFQEGRYDASVHGVGVMEHVVDLEAEELVANLKNELFKSGLDQRFYIEVSRVLMEDLGLEKSYSIQMRFIQMEEGGQIMIDNLSSDKGKKILRSLIDAVSNRQWWSRWISKNEFAKFVG